MSRTVMPNSKHTKRLSELNRNLDLQDLLSPGVYTTEQIYSEVQSEYPELCDDKHTVSQRYGEWAKNDNRPVWKYQVRWALKNEKKAGNLHNVGRGVWAV